MIDREKVIKGLECCGYMDRPNCADCPEDGPGLGYACRDDLMKKALALLKAQSEELDRLKLCRHNCEIECLLDEYNKVVAERDALRKAQEPVAPEKKSFLCAGECEYESTPLMNVCGACGEWLLSAAPRAKYCPNCGKAVRWE